MTTPQIKSTRDSFNKPTGMLIEDTIGRDELKKAFEDNKIDPKAQTKPAGMIAVFDLKIISVSAKDALMVGQAAERILRSIEKIENGTFTADDKYPLYGDVNGKPNNFRFIGTNPKEPKELQGMQVTMMAAQEYLNQHADGGVPDKKYVDGFKRAALAGYIEAAKALEREAPQDPTIAANTKKMLEGVKAVAVDLRQSLSATPGPSSNEFIQKMLQTAEAEHQKNWPKPPNDAVVDCTHINAIEKLAVLSAHAPKLEIQVLRATTAERPAGPRR